MSQPRLLLDASGLIALARLGLIARVRSTVGELHATAEVVAEAIAGDHPGAGEVTTAIEVGHLRVLEPAEPPPSIPGLGLGETATIRRAAELGMTAVIDDLDARRVAARLNVALTGTIAVLVQLARHDDQTSIVDVLDDLDRIGFRVSATVREWALGAVRRRR